MISLDKGLFKKIAKDIFTCDSPTGFTEAGLKVIEKYLNDFGYSFERLKKGGIKVTIEGKDNSKTVATSAHLDTLGLMVRSITSKGTLKLVEVGGVSSPSLDGEYCKVYTRDGNTYTGTVIVNTPAVHVYPDSRSKERTIENLEVRLDEEVFNKLQTTRAIKNNNQEITQVFIELPDNIKRGIKYDYDYMTKEFSLSNEEASSYIKKDYKERSKTRV